MRENIKMIDLSKIFLIGFVLNGIEPSSVCASLYSKTPVCCGVCQTFQSNDETSFFQAHQCPQETHINLGHLEKEESPGSPSGRPDTRDDADHNWTVLQQSIGTRKPSERPGDLPKLFYWG